MFNVLKPELSKINNIRLQEAAMYSTDYTVAGRVDCIGEYDGVLSVIDFKTSTKEKSESWIENYFIQGSAYSQMYKEHFGEERKITLSATSSTNPNLLSGTLSFIYPFTVLASFFSFLSQVPPG